MRPEEPDLAYFWDMRAAAGDIVAFVKGFKSTARAGADSSDKMID
jgi:hypothetical protein